MTLAFSTKWPKSMGELAGQQNYFIDKIWASLMHNKRDLNISHYEEYLDAYKSLFNKDFGYNEPMIYPKLHTIRADPSNRWKAGMKIHMVINNRTKDRFQFAPVIKCLSVQKIKIKHNVRVDELVYDRDGLSLFGCDIYGGRKRVLVDGIDLSWNKIKQLAINDGFPTVETFFQYFNEDFKGKLIHWTDLKY